MTEVVRKKRKSSPLKAYLRMGGRNGAKSDFQKIIQKASKIDKK